MHDGMLEQVISVSYPQVQVSLALRKSLHLWKSSFVFMWKYVVKNYGVESIMFRDKPFLGTVAWIYFIC